MKSHERKIKQAMPYEDVPAFLRQLADAIEKKADPLPEELADLPEPLAKLTIKGKPREDGWEMKVRMKAEAPPAPSLDDAAGPPADQRSGAAGQPELSYKDLKKRMKASFKAIGESIENQRLPENGVVSRYMADSQYMTTFSGAKYGEGDYPAYRQACRELARAWEARDLEGLQTSYAALDQLKKDCHKLYK